MGVNVAAKDTFFEEIRALFTDAKIHLSEFWWYIFEFLHEIFEFQYQIFEFWILPPGSRLEALGYRFCLRDDDVWHWEADSASRRLICGFGRQILLPGILLKAPGVRFCLWESDSRLLKSYSSFCSLMHVSINQILPLGSKFRVLKVTFGLREANSGCWEIDFSSGK